MDKAFCFCCATYSHPCLYETESFHHCLSWTKSGCCLSWPSSRRRYCLHVDGANLGCSSPQQTLKLYCYLLSVLCVANMVQSVSHRMVHLCLLDQSRQRYESFDFWLYCRNS